MRDFKEKSHSIVLLGSFQPSIFQPFWLASKKLIGPDEAQQAKVAVIHGSVSKFALEWVDIQVLSNRFTALTADDDREEAVRDLVIGLFKLLGHAQITAVGVNRTAHIRVEDVDTWHKIGHKLVPKGTIWNEILTEPGTRSVTVQGKRPDGRKGNVLVRVEPSVAYPNSIYVDVNDHFQIGEDIKTPGSGLDAAELIESVWKTSKDNSSRIIDKLKDYDPGPN